MANNGISNNTVITTVQPNKKHEAFNDVVKNKNSSPSTTDVPALSTKISIKKQVMCTLEKAKTTCCRNKCVIRGFEVLVEVMVFSSSSSFSFICFWRHTNSKGMYMIADKMAK